MTTRTSQPRPRPQGSQLRHQRGNLLSIPCASAPPHFIPIPSFSLSLGGEPRIFHIVAPNLGPTPTAGAHACLGFPKLNKREGPAALGPHSKPGPSLCPPLLFLCLGLPNLPQSPPHSSPHSIIPCPTLSTDPDAPIPALTASPAPATPFSAFRWPGQFRAHSAHSSPSFHPRPAIPWTPSAPPPLPCLHVL